MNGHFANMSIKATAYNYDSRLALLLSGRYIGFLPESYAQSYIDAGTLKCLAPQQRVYRSEIMAITKKTTTVSRVRSLFIKTLGDFYNRKI